MKRVFWIRFRAHRLVVIFVAVLVYIFLAFFDAEQTLSNPIALHDLFVPIWLLFGFSLSVALIFLAVGSLTWFYAHDRRVAFLLLCSSYMSMVPFALETASSLRFASTMDRLLSTLSGVTSSLALLLFAVLLLVFPRNHVPSLLPKTIFKKQSSVNSLHSRVLFAHYYVLTLLVFICFALLYAIGKYFSYSSFARGWIHLGTFIYYSLVIVGILTTNSSSFRQATARERQQLRFFVVGVILAFVPLLFLTVVPQLLGLFFVEGEITTLTLILLPLSLGYSILRYQFLAFDTYIRRTINWIIGIIFLAMLVYLVTIIDSPVLGGNVSINVVPLAIATAIFAPLAWWSGKMLTELVLFKESLYYRRLIDRPVKLGNEVLDLEKSGQLITVAAVQAFRTPQVCLFVLVEEDGC